MKNRFVALSIAILFLGMVRCMAAAPTTAEMTAESAKADAFFERAFNEFVDRNPEFQTQLGIKKDYDKWSDYSEQGATEDLAVAVRQLAELKRDINFDALDAATQLSYRLFVRQAERQIESFRWRLHNYPVNQMFGRHSGTPAFLVNNHRISDVKDAHAYISRLHGIKPRFEELVRGLEMRRERGVVPPRFVFPLVIESCRNLITGEPYDQSGKPNALLEDFQNKVAKLDGIDDATKQGLIAEAKRALTESAKPAYELLIAELESLHAVATDEDGVWKLPHGAEYYDYCLRGSTTLESPTADEIHAIGLREVARIHGEMNAIKEKVGFKGDLLAFFKFMREDPQFYFPNTPEGKQAYLKGAIEIIDRMRGRLDDLFLTKPKAELIVKAVEPFRERESGGAFYQRPAPDGSRPGMYYVNLYEMGAQPKYEMEALAFHEGLPGHHMQLAISQELQGIPSFRKFGSYTAYIEGWGLYCERIPKEMGFYADPYSDFGRLSMELWRAARLVVDTGIHAKRWTRQQTMDWLRQNTPNSDRDITTETNRYIVMPGQATAYKVGMLKLLELRERAAKELGQRFDVRAYHDVVLKDGPVPLDVLDENVTAWIARLRQR